MDSKKYNDIRCHVCLQYFNLYEVQKSKVVGCPNCKTLVPPLQVINDGYIKINWQELRVLATYARRWAMTFSPDKKGNVDAVIALENTITGIAKFRPRNAAPLLADEEVKEPPSKHLPIKSPYFNGGY